MLLVVVGVDVSVVVVFVTFIATAVYCLPILAMALFVGPLVCLHVCVNVCMFNWCNVVRRHW